MPCSAPWLLLASSPLLFTRPIPAGEGSTSMEVMCLLVLNVFLRWVCPVYCSLLYGSGLEMGCVLPLLPSALNPKP